MREGVNRTNFVRPSVQNVYFVHSYWCTNQNCTFVGLYVCTKIDIDTFVQISKSVSYGPEMANALHLPSNKIICPTILWFIHWKSKIFCYTEWYTQCKCVNNKTYYQTCVSFGASEYRKALAQTWKETMHYVWNHHGNHIFLLILLNVQIRGWKIGCASGSDSSLTTADHCK